MLVVVHNHYSGEAKNYRGDTEADILDHLKADYPWAARYRPHTLEDMVELIDSAQALSAAVVEEDHMQKSLGAIEPPNLKMDAPDIAADADVVKDMLGFTPHLERSFEAARFLSGYKPEVSPDIARQALYDCDGDINAAALTAYGIPVTENNVKALRSILQISHLGKGEPSLEAAHASDIEHVLPEGLDTAEAVRRAFKDSFVFPVQLTGKHSKGSLLARDQKSERTWLLKPGSGGQSSAAGSSQEKASQSRREAAFWHVAKLWGIDGWFPQTDLLIIDGKEFAAMELLPWTYSTIEKRRQKDFHYARKSFDPMMKDGVLHQWAVIDYVCGNPDRHGQNIMADDDGTLQLIDHGSAFAGPDFAPATDKKSFVPFYLRAWAPGNFSKLPVKDKLQFMPRLSEPAEQRLRKWIDSLSASSFADVLYRYGIDPAASVDRLARLKNMTTEMPADLAVNKLWITS